MARLSLPELIADAIDRMQALTGDLDARVRIARRRATLRELDRFERLEQQEKAQATLPLALPSQTRQGATDDPPPGPGRRSHGPAQMTLCIFGAAFAFLDSGEPFDVNVSPGVLGRQIAGFAYKHGLEGAEAMLAVADDPTMRSLMSAGLKAIRSTRGR
jgi:hypothetical protein